MLGPGPSAQCLSLPHPCHCVFEQRKALSLCLSLPVGLHHSRLGQSPRVWRDRWHPDHHRICPLYGWTYSSPCIIGGFLHHLPCQQPRTGLLSPLSGVTCPRACCPWQALEEKLSPSPECPPKAGFKSTPQIKGCPVRTCGRHVCRAPLHTQLGTHCFCF